MATVRYRKRQPPSVEAMQFTTNNEAGGSPVMDGIVNWINRGRDEMGAWHNCTDIFLKGNGGRICVGVGEWIIKGDNGSLHRYSQEEFDKLYESAEPS
jgi:hypothetical protein